MIIHVVQPGESLYKIAQAYGIPFRLITEENGLLNVDQLTVGQALVIPVKTDYEVRPGDSIYQIADRHNVTHTSLIQANPEIVNPFFLMPGQKLRMPADQTRGAVGNTTGQNISVHEKERIIVNGYTYPFADRGVLRQSMPYLTYLSVFSYEVQPDGSLLDIDDAAVLQEASDFNVAPRMVVSNISEENGFDADLAHTVLSNNESVDNLINAIHAKLTEKKYKGVDVDFEDLNPEDKEIYNSFIEKLSASLHQRGYSLSAALVKKEQGDIPIYAAHDYKVHGEYDDEVILMTYDWGYLYGPPMAVSPLDKVEEVIQYAITQIPPEKILLGIPNYAFDWSLPYEEGTAAQPLSQADAAMLAVDRKAEIQYDPIAQSPYFHYYDENEKEHVVWFEDARSIQAKLELTAKYRLGGISYWTVNKPFAQNWSVLHEMFQIEK